MKKINAVLTGIILLVVLFFLFFQLFLIRIEVGQVGVRLKQYAVFGEKGVEQKDFGPGWHRSLPFIDTWIVYDATVQTTEFTSSEDRQRLRRWEYSLLSREPEYSTAPATGPERIELKSQDGYTVQLDVTVKYRIMPEKAHKLYADSGGAEIRYKGLVRDQAQQAIRGIFGTMRTEEFYKPDVRREKNEGALEVLRTSLNPRNVEVVGILIRDISFDPAYERKILDKKLADQDVELNKSRATREEKRGLTNKILAETDAMAAVIGQEKESELVRMQAKTDRRIAEILAEARLEAAKVRADADLYAAELDAKGELLEREAEAEGERKRAVALQGSGGANLVARQAIGNLNVGDVSVSTLETPFLDVDAMVDRFGAAR